VDCLAPWLSWGPLPPWLASLWGVVLVIVDGVAAKHLADAWEAAPPDQAAAALQVVVAEESINFALASLFNILFAGVTFILLGLAVAWSGEYSLSLCSAPC
jgi:hypothetical protein